MGGNDPQPLAIGAIESLEPLVSTSEASPFVVPVLQSPVLAGAKRGNDDFRTVSYS